MGLLKELPKVYFERLLDSSPDIVVAVDRSGTVIFYNGGAKQTLGYTAGEVLGHPIYHYYPCEQEARRVMSALRSERHGGPGQIKNFETEFLNKAGARVPVAISGSIIYDEKGREQGSIGFAKEITELRAHEQLKTLGQLAIGLAHEINNPLESLVNQAEMLERYLREKASEHDYTVEHERIAGIKRDLRRIQAIVERVGELAAAGTFGTIEYLPGRLMIDLGLAEEPSESVEGREVDNHLQGKRILVVDDDPKVCSSMADILGSEGCRIVTTGSGTEALRYLRGHCVDLVLSDVVMPDMDGYELFQEIRDQRPELPVVLMTAYYYDKDHVIKRSRSGGLNDVIFKKPIDPSRLLTLIEARVGG